MPRQPRVGAFDYRPPPSKAMAGWALGLAIVPCCFGITTLVGIGLAITVLVKSRHGVDHGKGLAIAALVIGPIWLALSAIGLATGMISDLTSDAQRDESGQVTTRSEQSVWKLRNGDCFDDTGLSGLEGDEDSADGPPSVTGVPCHQAHQFEVFHQFDLAKAVYPGDEEVGDLAIDGCAKEFRAFVGVPFRRSRLDMFSLYPDSTAWSELDERTVTCAIGQRDELTTGSLRATRR
jgi:hypothetical protein